MSFSATLLKNELFYSYFPRILISFQKSCFFQNTFLVTVYLCLLIFAFAEILIFFFSFKFVLFFHWKDITLNFLKTLLFIVSVILVCRLPVWTCSLQIGGDSPILGKLQLYYSYKPLIHDVDISQNQKQAAFPIKTFYDRIELRPKTTNNKRMQTQPFTLPRSINWVPGTTGIWMVKSKLSPRSGSVVLR